MVQGMVISAVLAGSALMATRMMSTQKLALKTAETKDQIGELHKMIFGILANREHCLMTFGTVSLGANANISINEIRSKSDTSDYVAVFQTKNDTTWDTNRTYMNNNVRINSMILQVNKAEIDLGNPQTFKVNYTRFENDSYSRTGKGFGGKSITKTMSIIFQRDNAASYVPTGCYAIQTGTESDTGTGNEDLNKEFCTNLGDGAAGNSLYTWDDVTNTCTLKHNVCGDKEVFEGISSTGSAICRPFADYLPYFLDSTSNPCTGAKTQVSIVRDPVTNKVSIECY